ncbi:mandelate racemase/muconate lactonizing enzyme family protein [Microbacterium sulfonylureivorans]|uniref:mandelate racemase/muconate lactonizing enzyme family protein n=1 Tax=Microbacterium sulfonylureivorans TaxID=2486854 RepID=UPI000FD71944|nr:mandelate racemase/muconate lactonizing enzyme family protein [Microbacterium sulfonylureivorans]
MRIEQIELIEVQVPARAGAINSPSLDKPLHKLATGADAAWTRQFDEFPKVLLVATTEDGTVGYGESLRAPDMPTLRAMARGLAGRDVAALAWQNLPLAKNREYDGFELLVLDLLAKRAGLPLASLLGGSYRSEVPVSAWSGHRTPDEAAMIAERAQRNGATTLKLKCELDDDVVEIAAAVRERCGDGFSLIFDPNERFEELRHAVKIARGLERIGNVVCLEDPLPRWDLGAYAELRARTSIPIAIHVALGYLSHGQRISDVTSAIASRAADVFNFSAGIADFLRMAHIADAAGRPYWHGSEIDLGIMEAGAVHAAAASAGATLPSDIFGRLIRETDLLRTPLSITGSAVSVPEGPGLGVELDLDAVAAHELSRELVTAVVAR